LEVLLTIMAAAENGELVVHLERALLPQTSADLAACTASRDERPPASRGERLDRSSPVVCLQELRSGGALPDQREERAAAAGGAHRAQHDEVGGGVRSPLLD